MLKTVHIIKYYGSIYTHKFSRKHMALLVSHLIGPTSPTPQSYQLPNSYVTSASFWDKHRPLHLHYPLIFSNFGANGYTLKIPPFSELERPCNPLLILAILAYLVLDNIQNISMQYEKQQFIEE